jgi:tetratricopeptide (TPR) repeat protein
LNIRKELGDELAIAKSLNNIGILLSERGKFNKAVQYHQKSFHIRTQLGDKTEIGHNYASLSFAYIGLGRYKEALSTALLHLRNIKEIGKDVEHGKTHLGIALILAQSHKVSEAERSIMTNICEITRLPSSPTDFFKASVEEARRVNYYDSLIPALYQYGRYMYLLGKHDEGVKYIKEAKLLASNKGREIEYRKIKKICQEIGLKFNSI